MIYDYSILYKEHDPFKWHCMWGTNKSYRLVLYNLFEDCFEGKLLFFAIVCIPDGVFLKNIGSVVLVEMFEGLKKKNNPPTLFHMGPNLYWSTSKKKKKSVIFLYGDNCVFSNSPPYHTRLKDTGGYKFRMTGPKQW